MRDETPQPFMLMNGISDIPSMVDTGYAKYSLTSPQLI